MKAVITGASSGIGRELARLLAPRCTQLVLVGRNVQRLEALRAEHPAFDAGAEVRLLPAESDSVLGIERKCADERLIALFNFSASPQPALPGWDGAFTDLWTGGRVDAGEVMIPADGFLWLAE